MKLGVQKKKFKIWAGRTVFRKSTPNLTITRGKFGSNFEVFWNFFKRPLKVPSLARSVPKPLKVPSLARCVSKPYVGEVGGHQTRHYHRCRPPTSWSSAAKYEVRLLQVNCEWNEIKWWNDEMNEANFGSSIFFETFICFRGGVLKLNCYIGKKVQKNFLMGLKIWWSWGSDFFFQLPRVGRFLDFRPKL